jgi:hypothetical protein
LCVKSQGIYRTNLGVINISGYKINIQKSNIFLYTSNVQFKSKIWSIVTFTLSLLKKKQNICWVLVTVACKS